MKDIKVFWVSWYQPTEDERPIKFPIPIEWWNSGSRCSDGAHTICAMVYATSKTAAKLAIKRFWPEASEWRFCEEKELGWFPGNRFPSKLPKLSRLDSDRIFNEIQKRLHENCDGAPDGGHTDECRRRYRE